MSALDNIQVLFENEDLVAIAKPPGVVVNDADTNQEQTIQEWWGSRLTSAGHGKIVFRSGWEELIPQEWTTEFGTAEEIFTERGGVVHRLDKETSGVLLLAKNPGSLINLLMQFRLRQTKKRYLCLVHGKFSIAEDTVSFPIGRSTIDRMKFQVVPDGRLSETTYRVLNFYTQIDKKRLILENNNDNKKVRQLKQKLDRAYQGFSLVECLPKTGRTHQIRVHMTHLRHPLIADPIYVGAKRLNLDQLWCPRLFLHAAELHWVDPKSREEQRVECPLAEDLTKALTYLEQEG
jgi:23S rRNA pseudouridine1911/1915/1917 synthase